VTLKGSLSWPVGPHLWGGLLLATAAFSAQPALAGSATADSVWSQQNALQRASQSVPAGIVITQTRCQQFQVRGDFRYRCTVTWGDPASAKP
jgi:hypothetical protein